MSKFTNLQIYRPFLWGCRTDELDDIGTKTALDKQQTSLLLCNVADNTTTTTNGNNNNNDNDDDDDDDDDNDSNNNNIACMLPFFERHASQTRLRHTRVNN